MHERTLDMFFRPVLLLNRPEGPLIGVSARERLVP
jgi:hypothetical protein